MEAAPAMIVWMEKTLVKGAPERQIGVTSMGRALVSPTRGEGNRDIYKLMREVLPGDIVLHLVDNKGICGLSVVQSPYQIAKTPFAERYVVPLRDYTPLQPPLSRTVFFSEPFGSRLQALLESGVYPAFFTRYLKLQQGKYLTRVPDDLLFILDEAYATVADRSISLVAKRILNRREANDSRQFH
jgi:hypothetical protein